MGLNHWQWFTFALAGAVGSVPQCRLWLDLVLVVLRYLAPYVSANRIHPLSAL